MRRHALRTVLSAAARVAAAPAAPRAAAALPLRAGGRAACGLLAQSRGFAASAPPSLADILKQELSHEQENYEAPELVAAGPPEPFQVVEQPGKRTLTLSRTFAGKEKITVVLDVVEESGEDEDEWDDDELPEGDVSARDGEAEEEEEDEGDLASTFFSVQVEKGDKSVVFECVTDGVEVDIMRVDLGSEDDDAYTGPDFGSLDESLQDAFADFLADRGVDGALAEYLVEASVDKEQREYMGWLKAVGAFVRTK